MGGVKKAFKSVAKPFEKALGGVKDVLAPEIDTSAQEEAARQAAETARKQAEQQAQNARYQAEGAAQQMASQQQREQLQQAALEDGSQDFLDDSADVQVGEPSAPANRRKQFQASGTSSKSPSIRI